MDGNDPSHASSRWETDRIFNAAWAYDLAFSWDPRSELEILLAASELRPGARVLVPACGTGRIAFALAERGFRVEASDINRSMLGFARTRRAHVNLTYSEADMTKTLGDQGADCDAALSVCNSFRYLLSEADVANHLRCVRTRLNPGARYVVDLALNCDDSRLLGLPNGWTLERDGVKATARWTLTALTPPFSIETAEIDVETADGGRHRFCEEQPQRLWSWDGLRVAARRAELDVVGARTVDGSVADDPTRPGRYYVALARPEDSV